MLSKTASSSIFCVFSMTRPGIEPWSPGSLVNTLIIRPMKVSLNKNIKLLSFISKGQLLPVTGNCGNERPEMGLQGLKMGDFLVMLNSYQVFHGIISWWSFTGVWVTASLLRSPLLKIMADLSNAVVWMGLIHPSISSSFSSLSKSLGIVLG